MWEGWGVGLEGRGGPIVQIWTDHTKMAASIPLQEARPSLVKKVLSKP